MILSNANEIKKIIIMKFFVLGLFLFVPSFADRDGELVFNDLFSTFNNEQILNEKLSSGNVTQEIKIKEAVFYFVNGSLANGGGKKKEFLEKSIELLYSLWRKDKVNNRIRILLAYGYTSICATDIGVNEITNYIGKAKNLFTLVIMDLPKGIDARLGRIRLNMFVPIAAGRPDKIIIEDGMTFLETYEILDSLQLINSYVTQGLCEVHLALAMIYDHQKEKETADKYFHAVNENLLPANLQPFYKKLKLKYADN